MTLVFGRKGVAGLDKAEGVAASISIRGGEKEKAKGGFSISRGIEYLFSIFIFKIKSKYKFMYREVYFSCHKFYFFLCL